MTDGKQDANGKRREKKKQKDGSIRSKTKQTNKKNMLTLFPSSPTFFAFFLSSQVSYATQLDSDRQVRFKALR